MRAAISFLAALTARACLLSTPRPRLTPTPFLPCVASPQSGAVVEPSRIVMDLCQRSTHMAYLTVTHFLGANLLPFLPAKLHIHQRVAVQSVVEFGIAPLLQALGLATTEPAHFAMLARLEAVAETGSGSGEGADGGGKASAASASSASSAAAAASLDAFLTDLSKRDRIAFAQTIDSNFQL
jgi:hypothetical protein